MTQVAEPLHPLFHIAIGCFLLSNIQWTMLFLRLIVLLGNVCFIILAGILDVQLDMLLWNLALALINIFHIAVIFWERRTIRFSPNLEKLYVEVFSKFLTRFQFNIMQSKCIEERTARVNNTLICKSGNLCTTVYIVGEIDPSQSKVELRREVEGVEELLKDMSSYHWAGYVELIMTYTKRKLTTYKVSLLVAETTVPITYFEVDVEVRPRQSLMQVFDNKQHGIVIRKAIFARLLHYCSQDVLNRGVVFLEVQHDLCRAQSTYDFSVKTEEMHLIKAKSEEEEPIYILSSDEIDFRVREHSDNMVSLDAEAVPEAPHALQTKVKHRTN
jgi:hypothetical protein